MVARQTIFAFASSEEAPGHSRKGSDGSDNIHSAERENADSVFSTLANTLANWLR